MPKRYYPYDLNSASASTPEQQLLARAALAFEASHDLSGLATNIGDILRDERPAYWSSTSNPDADAWRNAPMFEIDPTKPLSRNVARQCRHALEDNEYALKSTQQTPAANSTLKSEDPRNARRTTFRYSPEEKVELEKNLRRTVYPQIKDEGFDRFNEIATTGKAEVNEPVRIQMQNIALMRGYLRALCDDYKECTGNAITISELSFSRSRSQVKRLAKEVQADPKFPYKEPFHTLVKDMLETADYLSRQTADLAAAINTVNGKDLLEKMNSVTIDFSGKRSR